MLDLRYERVLAAVQVGLQGEHGAVVQLGAGVQMRVGYGELVFEHEAQRDIRPLELTGADPRPLLLEQPITLDGGGALLLSSAEQSGFQRMADLHLPPDAELVLRTRQPGDRIAPPGLNGQTQKLSDWMINRKIPRQRRAHIPLIVTGAEIIAVIHLEQGIVAHPYHLPQPGWQALRLWVRPAQSW
jgi:tRNA(Ile)-lysidine synthetase-like protein